MDLKRFAAAALDRWMGDPNRKPAVVRGARQVGKTWLVRDLAKRHGLQLVELNFERSPHLADLFSVNRPDVIVENIEAQLATAVKPGAALLFLDEIQAAPELFSTLRWFKEDMPELPVVAAGSLLELALGSYRYSMPVGRVTYFYLEPMSFLEFVLAAGNDALQRKLSGMRAGEGIATPLHEKCLELYRDYCRIGGMPEVVRQWAAGGNPASCLKLQQDLLATFRDDFHKYGGEMDARLLANIMLAVAKQLGNKFIYSRVEPGAATATVKRALSLLSQAKVCSKVLHTTGNGLPLGAESNDKFFKALMLDAGMISAQLGLASMKPSDAKAFIFSNRGGIAEQFVGQQLRSAQAPMTDPQLFYWQRTGGRLGEIDYVVQHGYRVVPVEVKSGKAGSMKSLHQFMAEKHLDLAVRFDLNPPSIEPVRVKTTLGQPAAYTLLSLPVYLAERLDELIGQVIENQ